MSNALTGCVMGVRSRPALPEDMSRDELVDEVQSLRQELSRLQDDNFHHMCLAAKYINACGYVED